MKPITNEHIQLLFKKTLAVMEVENANPFRIRAYQNAIAAIQGLHEELATVAKRGNVDQIPAIGSDLAAKIQELLNTGKVKEWERLYKHVPAGMFSLLDIPGVGPKRAYQLATAFSLQDESTAIITILTLAQQGKIQQLEGFGEKLEQEIITNIARKKPKSERMRIDEGEIIAVQALKILEAIPEVILAIPLGSLRRKEETVGDVDIGVVTNSPETIVNTLSVHNDSIQSIQAMGTNVIHMVMPGNKQVDIKFQTPDRWGATLQHFTGSKFHNIALREYALQKGMSLSEHGIKYQGKLKTFTDEQSFYSFIGLDWIPPELRQNNGEIEASLSHILPQLVETTDIKGDFHTHTDYQWISSHDYGGSLFDLLSIANELGYDWLAIGDHNPSQTSYSSDEMKDLLRKRNTWIDTQVREWEQQTKKHIHIFKTLEVDILPNGNLAVSDDALDLLDFVMVSIHSRMALNETEQTKRITAAIQHPKVKILAHPTGRLITSRPPMQLNWPELFAACLAHHVALEINAYPDRLDLPDNLAHQALQSRIKLTIGSDAHHPDDLRGLRYGVNVARRAWAEKNAIINTYTYHDVVNWIHT